MKRQKDGVRKPWIMSGTGSYLEGSIGGLSIQTCSQGDMLLGTPKAWLTTISLLTTLVYKAASGPPPYGGRRNR